MTRRPRSGVIVAVCALLVVPMAAGARLPTLKEREAITRALPQSLRNTPTECVWLSARVSKSSTHALVKPVFLNAATSGSRCARYAADGFYVLRKSTSWKVIYRGSDAPPCSLRIPRDLISCRSTP